MNNPINSFKIQLNKLLKERLSVGANGVIDWKGFEDQDVEVQDKPQSFNRNPPVELTINALKYYMHDISPRYQKILNANDAKIIAEPDHPKGIYSVYSKSLNDYFDFSFNHPGLENYSIYTPES